MERLNLLLEKADQIGHQESRTDTLRQDAHNRIAHAGQ